MQVEIKNYMGKLLMALSCILDPTFTHQVFYYCKLGGNKKKTTLTISLKLASEFNIF